jgi:predicted RND superfamily exporter protein
MQRYTAHTGGLEQLQLIVDSGEEYGFVDPERVASAERIAARLLEHAEVAEALSIVPFLRHTHATLTGADAPTTPTTSRHVAEALETLEQGQQTLRVSSLIDAEWRRIRYFLWFAEPSGTTSSAREALVDIRNTIEAATALHVPESSWTLVGPGLYRLEAKQRSVRGLVGSIALFLAVAGIALAVTLRSPRAVFAILLPPLLALIGYFGISGWIGAQLSVTMLFASIVILGVGNDDALYFTLSYRRFGRQAAERPADGDRALMETYGYSGIPIVQTTLLIIVGCAPLLLSDYSTLRIMAFLIPVGMLVSTAATLLVTPRILRQNRDRIRRAEGFDQGGRI